jgi:hypothetical protein
MTFMTYGRSTCVGPPIFKLGIFKPQPLYSGSKVPTAFEEVWASEPVCTFLDKRKALAPVRYQTSSSILNGLMRRISGHNRKEYWRVNKDIIRIK